MSNSIKIDSLQRQVDSLLKFPDQNPNPVLKISMSGVLLYTNKAGIRIQKGWEIEVGDSVPNEVVAHAKSGVESPLEMEIGKHTFSFHTVPVPEFLFINIYGTDISAMKAITKFPDQNPNPVLRTDMDGALLYVNKAGLKIQKEWKIEIGKPVPGEIVDHTKSSGSGRLEMEVGKYTFSFHIVPVPQFEFINIYGTDITAMKAITKFPDQNPNPVLRTDMDGAILYVNKAGSCIKESWGVEIGDKVPDIIIESAKDFSTAPLELEVAEKTFLFHTVQVPEFDFVNIYGTDITAAKDNETILLKLTKYFSPQVYESIFSGDLEVKIQTKRKRLTVFFSDIKGFSEITERLEPEVLTEIITDYLTAMTNIAVKHGGTVDKYIGDAIMVFFGDPNSKGHKEDAVSCVEMAMEMNSRLWEIRDTWKKRGISQPLEIRIGIHTDICTVGNFGSQDRLDYTTIGNGVNLASRLESNARPNEILISEDTYLLIRESIHCERLNKINVKNIKHPIQTYKVVGKHEDLNLQIKEKHDGFSLFVDPKVVTDIGKKRELLERALELLKKGE
ncbi:adenylate/guanylate cyclase domain-containing protein [Bacteriovoracales bacterium]|nr:adenylate/guanylate cyclase domain-containing protein [Bacteriovoracales bacterium]